jgi:hypothetical protein
MVFCEIDEDDLELVSKYNWVKNKKTHTTYVFSKTGGKRIILHRLLMGLPDYADDNRIIDHKDGNGLNNKKENLTICDRVYNNQSWRRHHGNNNVGCVYFEPERNKWVAEITINKKRYRKRFLTKEDGRAFIDNLISIHTSI